MDKKILYTSERQKWGEWLADNYKTEKEIWFVFPKILSRERCLPYNEAVEEALCYGWVDGEAVSLDSLHLARRFYPPKKGESYSRTNIERLIWLKERNKIIPEVRDKIIDIIQEPYFFPPDIIKAIKMDVVAWENFSNFSMPYKRIRVAYIDEARNEPYEFKKRLMIFIDKTRENKMIKDISGIDKYY